MGNTLKTVLTTITIFVVLGLSSCELIYVSADRVYTEADDAYNSAYTEETGKTLDGDWIEINGTFNSSTDVDLYRVAVPAGKYTVDVVVYHNGREIESGLFGENDFPLSVSFQDRFGDYIGSTLIDAANGGSFEIDSSDARYVVLNVFAFTSIWGNAYTSGNYVVQLR